MVRDIITTGSDCIDICAMAHELILDGPSVHSSLVQINNSDCFFLQDGSVGTCFKASWKCEGANDIALHSTYSGTYNYKDNEEELTTGHCVILMT